MGWQPAENLFYDYEDVLEHLFYAILCLIFKILKKIKSFIYTLYFDILCVEIKKLATPISNQLLKRFKE